MVKIQSSRFGVTALASILVLAGGALMLGGCGGSSSSKSTPTAQTQATASAQQTVTGQTGAAGTSGSGKTSSAAKSGSGKTSSAHGKEHAKGVDVVSKPHVQRGRGGADEPVTPAIKPPNPCLLVSNGQAQAILGGPIVDTEAPLGPTCIFKVGHQRRVVTLAVETVSATTQARELKKVQRATVGGHKAYCGTLGTSELYVSLSGGRALVVTAPCGVAEALAAKALGRIKS